MSLNPIWERGPPLLKIENLNAGYGEIRVLDGISLNVKSGELVAIVGSNGAGKTTLLKTISGLLRPTTGRIILEDELNITSLSPHEIVASGIIQVPEGRQILSNMTVIENLLVGGQNPRARGRRDSSLEEIFQLFPLLRARKKQMAGTLSGGEQQMLAMGRGLMAMPRVLLLDEPSLGLSPLLVEELFEAVKRLNEQGLTVLLVEQNIMLSLSICRRGYVLENGKIRMSGESGQLLKDDTIKRAYLGI